MDIGLILSAFQRTLGQVHDRRFLRVLLIGVGLTLALLVAAYAGILWLLQVLLGPEATLPLIGTVTWLDDLVGWSSLLLMLILSVFLMIPVASAITSMFLEDVADAVEDRHFPHLPDVQPVPFWDALRDTVNFLGLLIAANTLALIVYAFVFWIPFAPLVLFWGLNGFLLGREYFTLAAMRREGRTAARALAKRHRMTIWAAGILMAIPLTIPIMNLLIPILGAATFTHIYHGLKSA
ncbi:EI24 domain-containing protein [Lutimaribacter sp. EGI FJ00015]|uniref:EI24 domain-containing protein n=1 Tax=Lutimaribacter degradans TaxID=2945989 RepID=A0ACC5ZTZ9_9RHOB|nr:EI24 domain-containing protein [Lutimaribacter sp. EGI FJ00013]MCM2561600.1 EI24 domain-containing protein [Lutimaribacter sp. EGI FJ00013]MCO0612689.1 EI24 domain-containing protein [Lutimaribacter sp. EGI FJ00015]MCO0635347.1 EI24 domain-containing protein [Lutimaribacter sp. EGI FJ00014]